MGTRGCLPTDFNAFTVFAETLWFVTAPLPPPPNAREKLFRMPLAQLLLLLRYRHEIAFTNLTPTGDFDWEANAMKNLVAHGTHSAERSGRVSSSL